MMIYLSNKYNLTQTFASTTFAERENSSHKHQILENTFTTIALEATAFNTSIYYINSNCKDMKTKSLLIANYYWLESTNERLEPKEERLESTNEQLELALGWLEPTNEWLELAHDRLESALEWLEPTNEQLEPTLEWLESTNERLEPTNGGLGLGNTQYISTLKNFNLIY